MGHKVWYDVVNCTRYGVPQNRKRLVLLASLWSEIRLISPGPGDVSVRSAIGNLPDIEDGVADAKDPLHVSRKLSDLNKKRIRVTKEGGGWMDWHESLRANCHRRSSGSMWKSAYGRMSWDKPAPTLTTYCLGYGNGRFGHPEQNRTISLREAALLQSFPKEYKFVPAPHGVCSSVIARHLGNAVPPLLARAIARSIKGSIRSRGT